MTPGSGWRAAVGSRLARNIALSLLGQLTLLSLVLIAARLMVQTLGGDALGLVMFTQALGVVVLAAAELGISVTTVRAVAAHSDTEPGYVRELIRTFTSVYWVLYAILVVVIAGLGPFFIGQWVHLGTLSGAAALAPFRILMSAALLGLPRSLYSSVFRGQQRLGVTTATDVAAALVQQAGVVLILVHGAGLFVLSLWVLASSASAVLAYVLLTGRSLGWATVLPGWSPAVLRRNFRFSLHLATISLLSVAHTQVDRLVVSRLLSLGSLGLYSVAANLVGRATLPVTAIAEASLPAFSKLVAAEDRSGWQRQYATLQQLVVAGSVPMYAAVVFAERPLFGYLFGAAAASGLLVPIVFLCAGWYMNNTLTIPYLVSLATGHPQIATRQNLLALVVVLPVSVGLVAAFGLPGAGLSWFAYHCFAYAFGVPRFCRQVIGGSALRWYANVLVFAGPGVAVYGTAWIVVTKLVGWTPFWAGCGFTLATITYAVLAWRVALGRRRTLVRARPGAQTSRQAA